MNRDEPRRLMDPVNRDAFLLHLALIFAVHLGLTLIFYIFRANLWLFPAIASGPYCDGAVQVILSIPGIFVFDLGLTVLILWGTDHLGLRMPAIPQSAQSPPPSRKRDIMAVIWRLALLGALNFGHHYFLRLWVFERHHAYELLGPGFTLGLPALDLALCFGVIVHAALIFDRHGARRPLALILVRLIALAGAGFFFAAPKLLVFPAFMGIAPDRADLWARLASIPILVFLTFLAVRRIYSFWLENPRGANGKM